MQDFQEESANSWKGVSTYYFAKFLLKIAWKWKNLDCDGVHIPGAPLGLPLLISENSEKFKILVWVEATFSGHHWSVMMFSTILDVSH